MFGWKCRANSRVFRLLRCRPKLASYALCVCVICCSMNGVDVKVSCNTFLVSFVPCYRLTSFSRFDFICPQNQRSHSSSRRSTIRHAHFYIFIQMNLFLSKLYIKSFHKHLHKGIVLRTPYSLSLCDA